MGLDHLNGCATWNVKYVQCVVLDNQAKQLFSSSGSNESYLNLEEQQLCRCQTFCPALQVFVLGGSWSGGQGGKNGEVFDPIAGTWRALSNVKPDVILTSDVTGVYRADNHGWFFGWLNGEGALPLLLCFQGAWP